MLDMADHPTCCICDLRFNTTELRVNKAQLVRVHLIPESMHDTLVADGAYTRSECSAHQIVACYICSEAIKRYFTDDERARFLSTSALKQTLDAIGWTRIRKKGINGNKAFNLKKLAAFDFKTEQVIAYKRDHFSTLPLAVTQPSVDTTTLFEDDVVPESPSAGGSCAFEYDSTLDELNERSPSLFKAAASASIPHEFDGENVTSEFGDRLSIEIEIEELRTPAEINVNSEQELGDDEEQVLFDGEFISPVELYQDSIVLLEVDEIHIPIPHDPPNSLEVEHLVLPISTIQTIWGEEIRAELPPCVEIRQDTAVIIKPKEDSTAIKDKISAVTVEDLQDVPADNEVRPHFEQSSTIMSPLHLNATTINCEQQSSEEVLLPLDPHEFTREDPLDSSQSMNEEMEVNTDHTQIVFNLFRQITNGITDDELEAASPSIEVDELANVDEEPEQVPSVAEDYGSRRRVQEAAHVCPTENYQPCSNLSIPGGIPATREAELAPPIQVNQPIGNQHELATASVLNEADHLAFDTKEMQTSHEAISQKEVDELVQRVLRRTTRVANKNGRPLAGSRFINTRYSPFDSKKRKRESNMAAVLTRNKRRRPGTPHPGEMDVDMDVELESSEFEESLYIRNRFIQCRDIEPHEVADFPRTDIELELELELELPDSPSSSTQWALSMPSSPIVTDRLSSPSPTPVGQFSRELIPYKVTNRLLGKDQSEQM